MIRVKRLLWSIVFLVVASSLAWGQFPKTGLVLYFTFEGGEGKTIEDDSENGNDAVVNGDPQWVEGKYDNGLQFDGATDHLVVEHSPLFDFTEMTAAAWVNWSGLSAEHRFIICQWNTVWIMRIDNEGHFSAVWTIDKMTVTSCLGGEFPQDEWQHVAIALKDGEQKIYRDGEVVTKDEDRGELSIGDANVFIGCSGTKGDKFGGIMDEVAVWNRALSENEITAAMLGSAIAVRSDDSLVTSWGRLKS